MIAFPAKWAGACLSLALMLALGATAQAADVQVHRGSQVTVESADVQRKKDGTRVAVQRGRTVERAAPAPTKVVERAPRISFSAGEEVWLVDRKTGKLVVCELRRTPDFGRDKIRCTDRSLSRLLR